MQNNLSAARTIRRGFGRSHSEQWTELSGWPGNTRHKSTRRVLVVYVSSWTRPHPTALARILNVHRTPLRCLDSRQRSETNRTKVDVSISHDRNRLRHHSHAHSDPFDDRLRCWLEIYCSYKGALLLSTLDSGRLGCLFELMRLCLFELPSWMLLYWEMYRYVDRWYCI